MSFFLKLSNVELELSKMKKSDFLLSSLYDYIHKDKGIFYRDENGHIFISTSINQHINRYFRNKYNKVIKEFPKFKIYDISFSNRFIFENGVEVDYELSNYKKKILSENKKHKKRTVYHYDGISDVTVYVDELSQEVYKSYIVKRKAQKHTEQLIRKERKKEALKKNKDKFKNIINSDCNLFSFDIEWWEKDTTKILEIGYSTYDGQTKNIVSSNILISENLKLLNGKYVDDNKFNFIFASPNVFSL